MAEATHEITSVDLDLLRAIHHESQQSRRGVTAEMCCVLSNCDTPAQREALVARINRLIAAPLRLLRMDPNDPERVCLSVDGRQVVEAAPWTANEASPGDAPTTEVEAAGPSHCNACGSVGGEFHAPECPAINAFEAGRIAGAVDDRSDDAEPGEQAPGSDLGPVMAAQGCTPEMGYQPQGETLVDGTASSRVEVTTLQVVIHPAGTHYQHPASILLSVENDGEGAYLTIKNIGGGRAVEIEDLATLDAVRIQAEKLLAQALPGRGFR